MPRGVVDAGVGADFAQFTSPDFPLHGRHGGHGEVLRDYATTVL
jgi:hypothetical protein